MVFLLRSTDLARVTSLFRTHPVVGIVGPRQVGKTTLARAMMERFRGQTQRFDLEDPSDEARLADPKLALGGLRGLVVIDEVQRKPELFPLLRTLADRERPKTKFIVLGSATPALLKQGSESLAGRIAYHELSGLSLTDVGVRELHKLWRRGGFPRAFLARSEADSVSWRQGFVRTFLERDIPELGISIASTTLRRFWTMLANYHGQIWNASEFGRAFGVSDVTVRRYLDTLAATFVVRVLQPWHENIGKRQVKAPKVFISDSGILHVLLGIETAHGLDGHVKVGASWEGFAMDAVIRHLGARQEQCFFWATHAGAELDLLVVRDGQRLGFEFKRSSAPRLTPSMRSAMSDLRLTRLDVVYPGTETFPLAEHVRAVPLQAFVGKRG